MKKVFLFLTGMFLLCNSLFSQQKVGLSASIQNSQFGIMVPLWLGEMFVLVPGVDLKYSDAVGTDLSLVLAPRFYIRKEALAPYYGARAGISLFMPKSDTGQLDLIGGLSFGLEYFLTDHLSFVVEAQGNLTKSAGDSFRFGNPGGINFNTGTMVGVTIYF